MRKRKRNTKNASDGEKALIEVFFWFLSYLRHGSSFSALKEKKKKPRFKGLLNMSTAHHTHDKMHVNFTRHASVGLVLFEESSQLLFKLFHPTSPASYA